MSIQVHIQGKAPAIQIYKGKELIETVRSTERLFKRARQEGWEVSTSAKGPVNFKDQNPAVLAKEIREENEAWASALSRAGQIIKSGR